MQIIKEYYNTIIERKTPNNPNAKPTVTGTVCTLRYKDDKKLKGKKLTKLFTEAVRDFPKIPTSEIEIKKRSLKIKAPAPGGYKKRADKVLAVQG